MLTPLGVEVYRGVFQTEKGPGTKEACAGGLVSFRRIVFGKRRNISTCQEGRGMGERYQSGTLGQIEGPAEMGGFLPLSEGSHKRGS